MLRNRAERSTGLALGGLPVAMPLQMAADTIRFPEDQPRTNRFHNLEAAFRSPRVDKGRPDMEYQDMQRSPPMANRDIAMLKEASFS